jgi:hypothetical protein
MRLNGQQALGVGMYASTPRGRRQETPSRHKIGRRMFLFTQAGESRELCTWGLHESYGISGLVFEWYGTMVAVSAPL